LSYGRPLLTASTGYPTVHIWSAPVVPLTYGPAHHGPKQLNA